MTSLALTSILLIALVCPNFVEGMNLGNDLLIELEDIIRFEEAGLILLQQLKPVPDDEQLIKDRLLCGI
jgi:hypothetical protein